MKVFLKTLGCKVNQCDSQSLRDKLFECGWCKAENIEDADLCVINTCCVTQSADRKSRNSIYEISRKKKSQARVLVTGCYASYDREALEKFGCIDAIFKMDEKEALLQWIETSFPRIQAHKNIASSLSFTPLEKVADFSQRLSSDKTDGGLRHQSAQTVRERSSLTGFAHRTRAFLKIQDGCNNRCSYCVVPLMRGSSRSKPLDVIREEAKCLIDSGYKEIVLTGVNLGSFGKDFDRRLDLVDCIDSLEKLDGLLRLRLSSIEAHDVTDRLLDKMASSKKLCPHLHIPFQSGDDTVLKAMNRKLSVRDYQKIVGRSYEKIKNLAITCDMIVGFPGEEEKHFQHTIDFLKFVKPLRTHIFSFSERKGVAVYGRKNPCDAARIRERYKILKELSDSLAFDFKSRFLEKNFDVLFEDKNDGIWSGYSPNYIRVGFKSRLPLRNAIENVQLKRIEGDRVLSCKDTN
jgi:threonylcarbamoyladenosine tRNA methylthiotransferase MtaB